MIPFFRLLGEMKNDPEYSKYYDVCYKFVNYLNTVDNLKIIPYGQYRDGSLTDNDKFSFNCCHRFGETWFKGLLAKMYLLDEWYQNTKPAYTFVTLTVSSEGRTIWDTFDLITKARNDFIHLLRNVYFKETFDYLGFLRPHKNGHPHVHMIIFKAIGIDDQIKLRRLWEKKGLGSFEHGLDFEVTENKESVRNLRNYCISYLTDSFVQTTSKYGQPKWTLGLLAFNAIAFDKVNPELLHSDVHKNYLKKRRSPYRFWSCSRNLSQVMKYDPDRQYGDEDFNSMFNPVEDDDELKAVLAEQKPKFFKTEIAEKDTDIVLGTIWRSKEYDKVYQKYQDWLKQNREFYCKVKVDLINTGA